MTHILIILTLLTFVIVYIVNYSGIIVDISKLIYNLTHEKKDWNYQIIKKPFSCYNCMTWWIILIVSLIMGQTLVLSLFFGALFGGFISVILDKLMFLFNKLINLIR